ncbi:MAG: hypothetical protein IMY72_05950 [Bacteroidetes bacterium]|nr:hypothetical protein [Bacteroidota bacterium]
MKQSELSSLLYLTGLTKPPENVLIIEAILLVQEYQELYFFIKSFSTCHFEVFLPL